MAVVVDEHLTEYAIWRPGAPDGVGDIHRGRVVARVAAMAGAFVAGCGIGNTLTPGLIYLHALIF